MRLRAPTQAPPAPPPTPGYEQGVVEGGGGGYVIVDKGNSAEVEGGGGRGGSDSDSALGGGMDGSVGDDGDEAQFVRLGGSDDDYTEVDLGIEAMGAIRSGSGGYEEVDLSLGDRSPEIIEAGADSSELGGTSVVVPAATGLGVAPKAMPLKRKLFRCGLVTAILFVSLSIPNLGVLVRNAKNEHETPHFAAATTTTATTTATTITATTTAPATTTTPVLKIDLIGAVSGSLLAIIIPSTIDLKCRRPAETPLVRNANKSFIVIGVVFGVWGTALAVDRAIAEFSGEQKRRC